MKGKIKIKVINERKNMNDWLVFNCFVEQAEAFGKLSLEVLLN